MNSILEPRILRNRARCRACGSEVESRHTHDYVPCACGAIAADGGHAYLRRTFNRQENLEELSEFAEPDVEIVRHRLGRYIGWMLEDLARAPSLPLMAYQVDNVREAIAWLAERGVDVPMPEFSAALVKDDEE